MKFKLIDYDYTSNKLKYSIDTVRYLAENVSPFNKQEINKLMKYKKYGKVVNYLKGKKFKVKRIVDKIPTRDDILDESNKRKLKRMIDELWENGSHYEREWLIDNGLI